MSVDVMNVMCRLLFNPDPSLSSIYVGALEPCTVYNVATSREPTKEDHSSAQTRVDILINKANLPDTVVWNPWIEKAKAMGDLGDEEVGGRVKEGTV